MQDKTSKLDNIESRFVDAGSERAVLTCIINNIDALVDVSAKLTESDFLTTPYRALFSILTDLFDTGVKSFDLMAVVDLASEKGLLETVGNVELIQAMMSSHIDLANLAVYVDKVLDCSLKLKLYKQAHYIQQDLLSNNNKNCSSDSLIAKAENRIIQVSMDSKKVEDALEITSGLRELVKGFGDNPVEISGISTGFPLLDKALNGLTNGSLTVIAARMKIGKSLIMMNMATHIAFTLGKPVLYIDTELKTVEVQTRLLAHVSAVPERDILTGKYLNNQDYCIRLDSGLDKLDEGTLLHKYYPGYTIDGLVSLIRKYHAKNNLGAVFFDYIKLPESSTNDVKESQELGRVATTLKDIAGKLDIPVIAAAQMKRGNKDKHGPNTYHSDQDVADSDKIARYCNNLLALGKKSQKEIEEDGIDCGTHRLQVLLARAGGAMYNGIDLSCHFPTLTMYQAKKIPQRFMEFGNEEG